MVVSFASLIHRCPGLSNDAVTEQFGKCGVWKNIGNTCRTTHQNWLFQTVFSIYGSKCPANQFVFGKIIMEISFKFLRCIHFGCFALVSPNGFGSCFLWAQQIHGTQNHVFDIPTKPTKPTNAAQPRFDPFSNSAGQVSDTPKMYECNRLHVEG